MTQIYALITILVVNHEPNNINALKTHKNTQTNQMIKKKIILLFIYPIYYILFNGT